MKIIIDTREQRPWSFPPEAAETAIGTLRAGDYALAGDNWAVERKSLPDFVGTVVREWERFQRELARLPAPRVVIVEGTLSDILAHEYESSVEPVFLLNRISALLMAGVAVVFAGDATQAAGVAYHCFRRREEKRDEDSQSEKLA